MMSIASISSGVSVRPAKFSGGLATHLPSTAEEATTSTPSPKKEQGGWLKKLATPLALATALLIPTAAPAGQAVSKALASGPAATATLAKVEISTPWSLLNMSKQDQTSDGSAREKPLAEKVHEKLLWTLLGTVGAGAAAASGIIISDRLSARK